MAYSMQKREDAATMAELTKKTASIVNEQLKKNRAVIMATLPRGLNYDRMCRTVINAVSTNSLLAKCSPASIFLSTVRAFALGIEPNGSLSEGYLIPFWDGKKGGYESQFMPSYRGLQNLARRSGEIRDIYAKAVCENDVFEVEEGTERKIVHKPDYAKKRGKTVCYYAVFHLKDGGVDFEVMSIDEIENDRIGVSAEFAKEYGVTLILKGHHTVVTPSDGTQYINITGNSGLAKGGSGDVLAGITAAFAARGIDEATAAVAAVYVHGTAADIAKERLSIDSMLATDVIECIPEALKMITGA